MIVRNPTVFRKLLNGSYVNRGSFDDDGICFGYN